MKRFKTQQVYYVFIMLIMGILLITGCGSGGGTENWAPSSAPTVSSTVPVDIAVGVCVNKLVAATFNKAMDASTITTPGIFTVKQTVLGTNVPGIVTYNAATMTATFTRTVNYTAGLNYTATIKGGVAGVKDSEGNAMAVDKIWSFTVDASVCSNPPPGGPASCAGPGPLDLGTAATFGVLAGTALTITDTGILPTSVTGNVGSPTITPASGPTTLVGTMYDSTPASELTVIATAVTDMQTAIGCANARTCDVTYGDGHDFGGDTLSPGVHCVTGAMSVGSNLTLTDPGTYIFRATGALTSAPTVTVALAGLANAANTSIFWVSSGAASDVSIGATNVFLGTIMVGALGDPGAATLGANTTLLGGSVLSTSAVTLDSNEIAIP